MRNIQYLDFVQSELAELETRDADTLFECIKENVVSMYAGTSIQHEVDDDLLYDTIEYCLREEKRGAK